MSASRADLKRFHGGSHNMVPLVPKPRASEVAVTIAVLRKPGNLGNLEPRLVPTHRKFQRWAVGQGSDEVLLSWDEVPAESRPPPLPRDEAIAWDQLVLRGDVAAKDFMTRWYLRPREAVVALARDMDVARTAVYTYWKGYLWYYRGRAQGQGIDV
jgi:hypothetical protein